ncbi:glycoside hydrolase family 12 protein [Vararia minispora EC-137]|uniref:Glycoside hydrolase family 12 protein n=1 Tax=Vararia minispora EC-137 TaxID=1314806 RepID=A0ACB8QC03_9AGAM|nr:glycoside hydrolase family 12 protein [Vararia minispora EC-137]
MKYFAPLAIALPLVAHAAPLAELDPRATTYCGQWDTANAGTYTLYLDQWGLSGASSGSDCATITSQSGSTVAWTTTWTWTGGTGVKSFTNIQQNSGINKQLSSISSIPSTWVWSQTSSGTVVADVAYDLFTSSSAGGSNQYEIMIWLANFNAGPISSSYNSAGQPVPVKSSVSIAGHTWNLYSGSNGANAVFSFLPTSGTVQNFRGDIKAFFTYLINNEGLSSSQYLTTAQAGTEATSGSATLTTSKYSLVIN